MTELKVTRDPSNLTWKRQKSWEHCCTSAFINILESEKAYRVRSNIFLPCKKYLIYKPRLRRKHSQEVGWDTSIFPQSCTQNVWSQDWNHLLIQDQKSLFIQTLCFAKYKAEREEKEGKIKGSNSTRQRVVAEEAQCITIPAVDHNWSCIRNALLLMVHLL